MGTPDTMTIPTREPMTIPTREPMTIPTRETVGSSGVVVSPPSSSEPTGLGPTDHWTRVAARPSPPATPRSPDTTGRTHRGTRGRAGWVAVKPRGVSAEAVAVRTRPSVGDTLEPVRRDAHDSREPRGSRPTNGHVFDDGGPAAPLSRALHPRSRAIRITRVKTNGRRRWSVDFLVRKADDANQA
jgi:hypothetical protein